jgi:hypothetical protein
MAVAWLQCHHTDIRLPQAIIDERTERREREQREQRTENLRSRIAMNNDKIM